MSVRLNRDSRNRITKIEFLTRFSLSVNGSRKRMQYGIREVSSLLIVRVGFFLMKSSYSVARSFIFVDVIKICREKKYPKRNGIHVCVSAASLCLDSWIELHLFSCFARHFIVIAQMPVEMTNEISIICVLDVRRQAPLKIRIARAWPRQHTEPCRPTVL